MSGNGHLRSFVERIERLEEEIKALNDDKSDIYKEAKGEGFDVKTLRRVIQARRKDPADRAESDILFDTYMAALEGGTEDAIARARTTLDPFAPPSTRLAPPAVYAAEPSIPSVDVVPEPDGQPDGLACAEGNQREAAPITEPVAPAPRSGQPLAGNPNAPPASGAPDLTIPPFLRRVPA